MENGYVILGIVALLFISMYGYAYLSVALEKIKAIREKKRNVHKFELRKQESLKKQEIIDEKVRAFNQRKEEIQKELMLLGKMKERQKVG